MVRSQLKIIYSDNATQFRAANKFLGQFWNKLVVYPQVCAYYASQGITWRSITEYASWKGGYYERLVGIVKSVLGKTIGRKILKFGDLRTLMYETAAMVDSRPLTYFYNESISTVIRLIHFLQCAGPTGIAPVGAFDDPY